MTGVFRRYSSAFVFVLASSGFTIHPASAGTDFVQLYLDAKGGCSYPSNPLSFVLTGPSAQAPFGKGAASWSDEDLTSMKADLAACQATANCRGNPYFSNEIQRDVDALLANVPSIVGQAREQARARAKQ